MEEKVLKLQKRLQIALKASDLYSANQIIRTLYTRMTDSRNYIELLGLLYNSFMIFEQAEEYNSAIDIAELFANVLVKSNSDISPEVLDKAMEMVALLPAKFESDDPESEKDRRSVFINRIIKWSLSIAANQVDKLKDTANLHLRLAHIYEDEGNEDFAQKHLKAAALLNQKLSAGPIPSSSGLSFEEGVEMGNGDGNYRRIDEQSEIELD